MYGFSVFFGTTLFLSFDFFFVFVICFTFWRDFKIKQNESRLKQNNILSIITHCLPQIFNEWMFILFIQDFILISIYKQQHQQQQHQHGNIKTNFACINKWLTNTWLPKGQFLYVSNTCQYKMMIYHCISKFKLPFFFWSAVRISSLQLAFMGRGLCVCKTPEMNMMNQH